jgi:hypothetical protein
VAVLVPEERADGIRQLAQELRGRQWPEPYPGTPKWRKLSPSTELLVDPESGACCAVRDTGALDSDRYLWTLTMSRDTDPIAIGRTADPTEARLQVESALAEVMDKRKLPRDRSGTYG